MARNWKHGLPRSHYDYVMDYVNRIGSFNEFADNLCEKLGPDPDWVTFATEIQRSRLSPLYAGESPSQQSVQNNVMFHLYQMYQNGQQLYYVIPELAVKLAKTELNVDTSFLKTPFPEIFVQIDPGLFHVSEYGSVYPVRGFYVYMKETGGIKEMRIMATAIINATGGPNAYIDDTCFYYRLALEPGKLKDSLRKYLSTVYAAQTELSKYGDTSNIGHMEEFTYFVVNLLLYLTSKDPDVLKKLPVSKEKLLSGKKSPGKLKKLARKMDKYTDRPYTLVGSHVPSNQSEVDQIKRSGGVYSWKLTHQFQVTGHWRPQWYGSVKENNRHQKVIWIENYVKGPDAAEHIHKKKVVV